MFKQSPKQSAVSNIRDFNFVFDPYSHWIAIENTEGKLPHPKILEKALHKFLNTIAKFYFKDYELKINLISKKDKIEDILEKSIGYKRVYAKISFKNGPKSGDILDEMAAKRINTLEVNAASAKNDVMEDMPEFMNDIVRHSPTYGESRIRYKSNRNGRDVVETYDSKSNPFKIIKRRKNNESLIEYLKRVLKELLKTARERNHV